MLGHNSTPTTPLFAKEQEESLIRDSQHEDLNTVMLLKGYRRDSRTVLHVG